MANAVVEELAVMVEGVDALVAGGTVLGGLEGSVGAECAEMDRVLGARVRRTALTSLNDVIINTTKSLHLCLP